MMIARILRITTVSLFIAVTASAQITISERVRVAKEKGETAIAIGVLGEPVVMTTDDLVKRAPIVVEGRVSLLRTYINGADTAVLSDFAVMPTTVLAGHVPPAASETPGIPTAFIVTTYGGQIVKDGVAVRAQNHSSEQLKDHGVYLLFLKPFGNEAGHFDIVNAAAFEIVNDRVRPLARQGQQLFKDLVDLPRREISRRVAAAASAR